MFAVPAISRLINNISSESFHFWLSCLRDVSLAECALMNEKPLPEGMTEKSAASKTTVIENISIALVHYSKAIAAIKVMDVHKKLFVYLNFFAGCWFCAYFIAVCFWIFAAATEHTAVHVAIGSSLQFSVSAASSNCNEPGANVQRWIPASRQNNNTT